jgi:transcription-repair coupling factor (superfamily II helicase)
VTLFHDLWQQPEVRQRPLLTVRGALAGAKGYLLARLFAERRVPLLVVTPDARQRDLLYDDLRCFLQGMSLTIPPWQDMVDIVCRYEHQVANAPGTVACQQGRAVYTYQPLWRLLSGAPVIVVTSVASLRYGVVPTEHLRRCWLHLRAGASFPLQQLVVALVEQGYRRVPIVESIGEFAVRGGLVDVFSPGQRHPVRIEFFGDEMETIRAFEPQSQISTATFPEAFVAPVSPLHRRTLNFPAGFTRLRAWLLARGWDEIEVNAHVEYWDSQSPAAWPWGLEGFFYDMQANVLSYLPETGLLCCVDTEDVFVTLRHLPPPESIQIGDWVMPLPAPHLFDLEAIAQQLQSRLDVSLVHYDDPSSAAARQAFHIRGTPQFFGVLDRFIAQVREWLAEKLCVLILCRFPLEVQRLQDFLAAYDLGGRAVSTLSACLADEAICPGTILLSVGEVSQGFIFPEARLVVLREEDIFGEKKRPRPSEVAPSRRLLVDLAALQPGDRVVHIDYGIGLYRGMTLLEVGSNCAEFMELEYADGAKLYVPTDRLSMVQKYTGGDGEKVPLDRLGGTGWARTKERVKASLLAMAEDLVKLHAARQMTPGYSFSSHTALHREFESRFEYVETEDQLRAIQQVMADMERPRAMERLVCGDVGYGKTEVAIRAAFKAVYDGKQVAVLVPTTVLAQQHYETFQRRFASYPVEIGVLSRLRSRKEQQQVLDGLQAGQVDVVIGTHRLLQKDVRFKALGLLVVDEEHRFGVGHKERIKQLSTHVDVLTLTATPIPRSLHMALVGLRDFSIIETPPEGRSAIETFVVPFAEETIQQAIRRELARGGQVFFVHNHIDTLPAIQTMLERLVPECRIGLAHGQMPESRLESIMVQFLERDFDLLLCTTIIESGLDIPSVNTIIIHQADHFGLAQLYQLRGRVGRSTQQAYAYLLIPGAAVLSDTARKRIEAIEEFNALGSSFHLAARDLEIRGAGNLLGSQQSGHIASIGFQLYCQMLEEAIHTTQGDTVSVRVDPELRLEVQGYIPRQYVESEAQRLELYQRFATVEDVSALTVLGREVQDRFGAMPAEVERIIAVVELKILARRLAIERLVQRRTDVFLTFHPQTPVPADRLLRWLQTEVAAFRFQSEHVVCISIPEATAEARLARLKKHLQELLVDASM